MAHDHARARTGLSLKAHAMRQACLRAWQHPLAPVAMLMISLLLGMLAWQFNVMTDHTHNHRNTLSAASTEVLRSLPGQIEVTAFCSNSPFKGRYFRKSIQSLLQRYQYQHPDLHLQFVDPASQPALARAQQIKKEGEMIVSYHGQQARLYLPYTEEAFTNLLLRLKQGARSPLWLISAQRASAAAQSGQQEVAADTRPLASLFAAAGLHLEQDDTSRLALALAQSNHAHQPLPTIILNSSGQAYDAQQAAALVQHIQQGGNLVWVVTSPAQQGLQALADALGIELSAGMVIDPSNRQFDIAPHALSTQRYAGQGPTEDFALRTFFEQAHVVIRPKHAGDPWKTLPMVAAAEQGWVSARYQPQQPDHIPAFDKALDMAGPATVVLGMERVRPSGDKQRIVIIGSEGFFNAAQQQRGGNQALTVRMVQWLLNNQPSVTLATPPLRDSVVVLPEGQSQWRLLLLFNGFQFGLPLLLLLTSGWIWWRRRRQ